MYNNVMMRSHLPMKKNLLKLIVASLLILSSTAYAATILIIEYPDSQYYNATTWQHRVIGTVFETSLPPPTLSGVWVIVQRLSDNRYWNGTTRNWQSSFTSNEVDTVIPGSPIRWELNAKAPKNTELTDGVRYHVDAWARYSSGSSGHAEYEFMYDTTPPLNPTSCQVEGHPEIISGTTWANLASPAFSWSGASDSGSGIYGYYYYFGTDPSGMAITTTREARASVSATSNATYYFRARSIDNANNQAADWQTMFTYKYDGTPPADFTINYPLGGSSINENRPTFSWNASFDGDSGINRYEVYIDDLGILVASLPPTATSYTPSTPLTEGAHYWLVKCVDNAGNIKDDVNGGDPLIPGKANFTVDLTRPTLNISSPTDGYITGHRSLHIFGLATDNIKLSTLEVLVGGVSALVDSTYSGTSQVVDKNADLAEGRNTVTVRLLDAAGNADEKNLEITYDPTAPETFDLLTPANNSWTNANSGVFTWERPQDLISGIDYYDLYVGGTKQNTAPITGESYPVRGLTEGNYSWFVQARDRAGNITNSAVWNLRVDNTPPTTPTLVSPAADAVNNELAFSWTACTDILSGMAGYDLYVNRVKKAAVTENSVTLTEPLEDGIYSWDVESRDLAGNTARSASRTVIINKHGPDISVTVDGNPLLSGAAMRSAPRISSTISDAVGVDTASIKFTIDGNVVSGLTINASSVSQCGFEYSPISQLKGGTHTLKIEATDTKGVSSVKEIVGLQVAASAAIVGKPMNYPNPFRPQLGETTKINYTLTDDAAIEIIIFDLAGRQVKKLFFSPGTDGGQRGLNEPPWDGSSTLSGDKAANGVYPYYIRSQGSVLGTGEIAIHD